MSERIDVGLLGVTGTVGLQLAQLLQRHPWFRLTEVAASPGSAGRRLGAALAEAGTAGEVELSPELLDLALREPDDDWSAPLLLSALPSPVAGPLEVELARRGHAVVSNASAHRMDSDVPLIIPEINPGHLALLERQRARWPGALITNPNCSVVGLTVALAPLHRGFGVDAVTVTTLQALSGAGRPGPAAAEMLDNVLPYIAGEEEKLACEPQKILGELTGGDVRPAPFPVSPQTHRVPVSHGHTLAVSVKLGRPVSSGEVAQSIADYRGPPLEARLPSASERPLDLLGEQDRPQPRLDRGRGGGMTVSVGRVRPCETLDVKFSVLVHNLIRGAAGAALLNAELWHAQGAGMRAPAR